MSTRPLWARAQTGCAASSGVIARQSRPKDGVDRATQYSSDVGDSIERPRRTGSSAFAEDDKLRMTALSPLLPTPPRSALALAADWRGLLPVARSAPWRPAP